jgi:hypothetical protein
MAVEEAVGCGERTVPTGVLVVMLTGEDMDMDETGEGAMVGLTVSRVASTAGSVG